MFKRLQLHYKIIAIHTNHILSTAKTNNKTYIHIHILLIQMVIHTYIYLANTEKSQQINAPTTINAGNLVNKMCVQDDFLLHV